MGFGDILYYCGEYSEWVDGRFSIDGETDTGFEFGTSLGNDTSFWVYDWPCFYGGFYQTGISASFVDGTRTQGIELYADDSVGNGIANVPNPWGPASAQNAVIRVWDFVYSAGVRKDGYFSIDSFMSTIIIDGCDTGIQDFVYEGKTISQHIADCASSAKKHGHFVSCVAKLTNSLKKAKLISGREKGAIMDCAAKSSIGK